MDAPVETAGSKSTREGIEVATSRAIRDTEKRIIDREFDGFEGAIQLAGDHLAYTIQSSLLLTDANSEYFFPEQGEEIRLRVSKRVISHPGSKVLTENGMRAIRDAQVGNYINLTDALNEEITRLREYPEIYSNAVKLQNGLEKLIAVIPTHGSYLYRLPKPAQIDERFNGELDKYSDK